MQPTLIVVIIKPFVLWRKQRQTVIIEWLSQPEPRKRHIFCIQHVVDFANAVTADHIAWWLRIVRIAFHGRRLEGYAAHPLP